MQFGDYQIAHPLFGLLVLLIPIGAWVAARYARRGTLRFSTIAPFRRIRPSLRVRLRGAVPALRLLALLLIIAALMRPQKGVERAPEKARGIGILLAIDNSGSMRAEDFEVGGETVSRIEAVKRVGKDFIKGGGGLPGRLDDEIGIISFSGYPVPRAPLTLDHGAVIEVLESIEVADPRKLEIDRFGRPLHPEEVETAIGDALARAVDRLKDVEVKSKVIILLSDGRQTTGTLSVEEGAKIASAYGVKVYTIGIGQAGIILVTEQTLFGPIKRRQRSDLDEDALRLIAEETGGRYFNAADTEALRRVYEEIDRLEASDIQTPGFARWDEKFQPLALAALLLIAIEVALSQTIFRRIP